VFVALALGLPACGGMEESGVVVDWGILDVGDSDDALFLACAEVGGRTVVLESQDLTRGGAVQRFSFPCDASGGIVPGLLSGRYAMTLSLLRTDSVVVSSLALGTVSVGRRGNTNLGLIVFDIQSLSMNWLVKKASDLNTPVGCPVVGATQVELIATAAGQPPNVFGFPCGPGKGRTQAVTSGAYAIQARLLNAAGEALDLVGPAGEATKVLVLDYVTPTNSPGVLPLITFAVK
jgi:hypothetical protein